MNPNAVKIQVVKKSWLWCLWKLWFPTAKWREIYVPFGRTIYIPGDTISHELMLHEQTHCKQQGFSYSGALKWHIRYRFSRKFRLSQEIEAYRNQIELFNMRHAKFRDQRNYKNMIVRLLSSPMYGNIVSPEKCHELLDLQKEA